MVWLKRKGIRSVRTRGEGKRGFFPRTEKGDQALAACGEDGLGSVWFGAGLGRGLGRARTFLEGPQEGGACRGLLVEDKGGGREDQAKGPGHGKETDAVVDRLEGTEVVGGSQAEAPKEPGLVVEAPALAGLARKGTPAGEARNVPEMWQIPTRADLHVPVRVPGGGSAGVGLAGSAAGAVCAARARSDSAVPVDGCLRGAWPRLPGEGSVAPADGGVQTTTGAMRRNVRVEGGVARGGTRRVQVASWTAGVV